MTARSARPAQEVEQRRIAFGEATPVWEPALVATAALLLLSVIGRTQEKTPVVQTVIKATSEKVEKAALATFVSHGYSIDSDVTAQVKASQPVSNEETAAYNTEHWTNQPVANCRRVVTLTLLPGDQAISVSARLNTVCHSDGLWITRGNDTAKDIQWVQTILAELKAKAEGVDQRR